MNSKVEINEEELEAQALEMSAETLGKDLMGLVIQELKALPDVWQKLPKHRQDEVIGRIRMQVVSSTKHAVSIIAAQGRAKVVGELESITIKNGTKAVIKVNSNNASSSKQELYESEGQPVHLVLASAEQYIGGVDEIRGEEDQHDMFENKGGDTPDPLLKNAIEYIASCEQVTISALQRELKIGYNRAAKLIETLESSGLVSSCEGDGIRKVDGEKAEEALKNLNEKEEAEEQEQQEAEANQEARDAEQTP